MQRLLTRFVILSLLLLAIGGCGSDDGASIGPNIPTASEPVIVRLDPDSGMVGDTLTLFGFGYSVVPEENLLFIGGAATPAEEYDLATSGLPGEIEQLTFTIPAGTELGDQSVLIVVDVNPSNGDLIFTVLP